MVYNFLSIKSKKNRSRRLACMKNSKYLASYNITQGYIIQHEYLITRMKFKARFKTHTIKCIKFPFNTNFQKK